MLHFNVSKSASQEDVVNMNALQRNPRVTAAGVETRRIDPQLSPKAGPISDHPETDA